MVEDNISSSSSEDEEPSHSPLPTTEVPSTSYQRDTVDNLMRATTLVAGDAWYLVWTKWLESWRAYINGKQSVASPPGPVDNSPLVDDNGNLLHDARENR